MTTPREPDAEGDALLERYRRASAAEPLGPSDAVRAAILAEAVRQAAENSVAPALTKFDTSVRAANQWRWTLTGIGTAAAAVIAGLLVVPHYREAPQPPEVARETAAVPTGQQGVAGPATTASVAAAKAAPPAPAAPSVPTAPSGLAREQATRGRGPVDSRAAETDAGATPPGRRNGETHATVPQARALVDAATNDAFTAVPPATQQLAGVTATTKAPPNAAAHTSAPAVAGDPAAALRAACAAGDTQAIAALLAAGAPLEDRDPRGRTALMVAAARGRIDAVRLLLAHGASTQPVDREGQDAVALARRGGFEEVAAELERAGRR